MNHKPRLLNYLSLVKFSHTVFAMPFAIIGFFLAVRHDQYPFSWSIFIAVILCMVFARTAAIAFNRYVDREIDGKNPRTALREIPSGIIRPKSALHLTFISSLLFMAAAWLINPLVFKLSPIALLIILGYSFTKTFTTWSHLILGLGLSLAPLGAYLAVTSRFALLPVLYSLVVIFWVSGFDILYALQDEWFDRQENLHSVPVRFGRKKSLIISAIFHLVSGGVVLLAGFYGHFGLWYWIGSQVFLGLLIYQHIILSSDDISRLNTAFFTTNGIASILFALFFLLEVYL